MTAYFLSMSLLSASREQPQIGDVALGTAPIDRSHATVELAHQLLRAAKDSQNLISRESGQVVFTSSEGNPGSIALPPSPLQAFADKQGG